MHSFALNLQALGTPQHVCSYHTSNTKTLRAISASTMWSSAYILDMRLTLTIAWGRWAALDMRLDHLEWSSWIWDLHWQSLEGGELLWIWDLIILDDHLGYETYIDNRLGEVSCFVLSTKQAWWGRVQAPGRVGLACCAKDVCLGFCFLPLSRDFAVSPLTYKSRQNQNHVSRRASWTTYKGGGVRALSGCAS